MKYLIVMNNLTGDLYPIVFPEEIPQATMAYGLRNISGMPMGIRSAGLLDFDKGQWTVRPQGQETKGPMSDDEELIRIFFATGLTGKELTQMLDAGKRARLTGMA